MNGELAGPGSKQISLDAQEVSATQESVEFKKPFAYGVSAHVVLQPVFTV